MFVGISGKRVNPIRVDTKFINSLFNMNTINLIIGPSKFITTIAKVISIESVIKIFSEVIIYIISPNFSELLSIRLKSPKISHLEVDLFRDKSLIASQVRCFLEK